MGRRSDERTFTISDRDVRVLVTQYDAFDALDLFVKLMDVIAPSAGTIISGLVRGTVDTLATIEGDDLAAALQGTIGKIANRAAREAMIFQIFRGTQAVLGEQVLPPTNTVNVGAIFEADLMAMFSVLGYALEIQYGNFWLAVSKELEVRRAQAEAAKIEETARVIKAAKAKAAEAPPS